MKDPDDDNFGFSHLEDNRRPTFESHSAKTLPNVVTFCASFGKDLQSHTGRLDPFDVGACGLLASFLSDMMIEPE